MSAKLSPQMIYAGLYCRHWQSKVLCNTLNLSLNVRTQADWIKFKKLTGLMIPSATWRKGMKLWTSAPIVGGEVSVMRNSYDTIAVAHRYYQDAGSRTRKDGTTDLLVSSSRYQMTRPTWWVTTSEYVLERSLKTAMTQKWVKSKQKEKIWTDKITRVA